MRSSVPLWKTILAKSMTKARDFSLRFGLDEERLAKTIEFFPARINSYFLRLIQSPEDPLGRQVIPNPSELEDGDDPMDPLGEEAQSPVPNLIHRYPDRVVLLVSNQCAVYCRFCNRKRKVARRSIGKGLSLEEAFRYIVSHREVRDVLISGGDPLLMEDRQLELLLARLRAIPHVEILRIGTRVPSALPQRITRRLCRILRRYAPIYISLHFNHPLEITDVSAKACSMLADSGLPLGSQTVLLKGVNDDPQVILNLMEKLAKVRVRPYYLFQLDPVRGSRHFRTPVELGIETLEFLSRKLPLELIPHFALDLPGGGGKVTLGPRMWGAERESIWYIDQKSCLGLAEGRG
jgi:lysine 2,3-aminomutase